MRSGSESEMGGKRKVGGGGRIRQGSQFVLENTLCGWPRGFGDRAACTDVTATSA